MIESRALGEFEQRLPGVARRHLLRQVALASRPVPEVRLVPALAEHIEKQLRRERMKARAGHAGYDFNRHLALLQLSRSLCAASRASQKQPRKAKSRP